MNIDEALTEILEELRHLGQPRLVDKLETVMEELPVAHLLIRVDDDETYDSDY